MLISLRPELLLTLSLAFICLQTPENNLIMGCNLEKVTHNLFTYSTDNLI